MTFEQKLFTALRGKRSPVRKRRKGHRRGPWRSEARLEFARTLPCCNCGKGPRSEPAHLHTNGTSSKCSDEFTAPLCHGCHDQYDGRAKLPNGEFGGHEAFERYYAINLLHHAIRIHADWLGLDRDEECSCVFAGDQADARGCAAHGEAA